MSDVKENSPPSVNNAESTGLHSQHEVPRRVSRRWLLQAGVKLSLGALAAGAFGGLFSDRTAQAAPSPPISPATTEKSTISSREQEHQLLQRAGLGKLLPFYDTLADFRSEFHLERDQKLESSFIATEIENICQRVAIGDFDTRSGQFIPIDINNGAVQELRDGWENKKDELLPDAMRRVRSLHVYPDRKSSRANAIEEVVETKDFLVNYQVPIMPIFGALLPSELQTYPRVGGHGDITLYFSTKNRLAIQPGSRRELAAHYTWHEVMHRLEDPETALPVFKKYFSPEEAFGFVTEHTTRTYNIFKNFLDLPATHAITQMSEIPYSFMSFVRSDRYGGLSNEEFATKVQEYEQKFNITNNDLSGGQNIFGRYLVVARQAINQLREDPTQMTEEHRMLAQNFISELIRSIGHSLFSPLLNPDGERISGDPGLEEPFLTQSYPMTILNEMRGFFNYMLRTFSTLGPNATPYLYRQALKLDR